MCSFAPSCPNALPEAPAQLHSCPSSPSSAHPPLAKALLAFAPSLDSRCWAYPELVFPTSMAANSSRHCCCARGQGRMAFHLQGTVPPSPSSCSPLCITSRGESLQPAKGDLLRHTRPQTSTSYGTSFFHTAQIFSQTKGLSPITMSREQWEAEAGDHGGQFIFLSAGTRLSFAKCPRRNSKHSEKSHL